MLGNSSLYHFAPVVVNTHQPPPLAACFFVPILNQFFVINSFLRRRCSVGRLAVRHFFTDGGRNGRNGSFFFYFLSFPFLWHIFGWQILAFAIVICSIATLLPSFSLANATFSTGCATLLSQLVDLCHSFVQTLGIELFPIICVLKQVEIFHYSLDQFRAASKIECYCVVVARAGVSVSFRQSFYQHEINAVPLNAVLHPHGKYFFIETCVAIVRKIVCVLSCHNR